MPVTYSWLCGCGTTGRGEIPAQRHSKVCPLFGYPWTNLDYPKPGATT